MGRLYKSVALIEAAEPANLDELIASGLGRFVVRRLGPTAAVVDHARLDEMHKLLKQLGQTPRIAPE